MNFILKLFALIIAIPFVILALFFIAGFIAGVSGH